MSRITFIEMVENIKHAMIPGNDIKIEDIIKKDIIDPEINIYEGVITDINAITAYNKFINIDRNIDKNIDRNILLKLLKLQVYALKTKIRESYIIERLNDVYNKDKEHDIIIKRLKKEYNDIIQNEKNIYLEELTKKNSIINDQYNKLIECDNNIYRLQSILESSQNNTKSKDDIEMIQTKNITELKKLEESVFRSILDFKNQLPQHKVLIESINKLMEQNKLSKYEFNNKYNNDFNELLKQLMKIYSNLKIDIYENIKNSYYDYYSRGIDSLKKKYLKYKNKYLQLKKLL
jgi:hypothetical protein